MKQNELLVKIRSSEVQCHIAW